MPEKRGLIIFNTGIVAIILAVVILSQQPFMRPFGRSLYAQGEQQTKSYASQGLDWLKAKIFPRLTQEAEKRGEALSNEVTTQKNNAMEFIWEKIKNYFAEKFSNFSGTKVE